MNSKKVVVYQDKKTGSIFICPMKDKGGKFVTKSPTREHGSAKSNNIPDEELGKMIRKALEEAD